MREKIVAMVRFYLSNVGLAQDASVRNLIGRDRYVLLSALLLKPKLRCVCFGDWHIIREALALWMETCVKVSYPVDGHEVDLLEADVQLSPDGRHVRRTRRFDADAKRRGAAAAGAIAATQAASFARGVMNNAKKFMGAIFAEVAARVAADAALEAGRASNAARVAHSAAAALAKRTRSEKRSSVLGRSTRRREGSVISTTKGTGDIDEGVRFFDGEDERSVPGGDPEVEDEKISCDYDVQSSLKKFSERGCLPSISKVKAGTVGTDVIFGVSGEMSVRDDTLHSACFKCDAYRAQTLLSLGADPNKCDKHGMTPLHHAVASGSLYVTALLLLQRANIAAVDRWKRTPLHIAVERHHIAMVKLLTEAGAPLDAVSIHGQTPLESAIDCNYTRISDFLIMQRQPITTEHRKKRRGSLLVGKFREASVTADPELAKAIKEETEMESFMTQMESSAQLAARNSLHSKPVKLKRSSLLVGDLKLLFSKDKTGDRPLGL